MYANGQGVPKDQAEALKLYRLASAKGYALAQYNLGVSYALGHGLHKDETTAAKWYRKAAEQGFSDAQNNLGFVCQRPRRASG